MKRLKCILLPSYRVFKSPPLLVSFSTMSECSPILHLFLITNVQEFYRATCFSSPSSNEEHSDRNIFYLFFFFCNAMLIMLRNYDIMSLLNCDFIVDWKYMSWEGWSIILECYFSLSSLWFETLETCYYYVHVANFVFR